MSSSRRLLCSFTTLTASLLAIAVARGAPPETRPVDGLRENTPRVHAFTKARVVVAPGRVLDEAALVVRDGIITEVGPDVTLPSDARVWDLSGRTIYPGLIDAYDEVSLDATPTGRGAPYWNSLVCPQRNVADQFQADASLNEKLRSQGVTARLVAPQQGIVKGTSALVSTGDELNSQSIFKRQIAQHLRLTVPRGRGRDDYPNSPMGAVALARQAMCDAAWYRQAWVAHRAKASLPQPEQNEALEVLQRLPDSNQLLIADASSELFFLRADRYAREFGLNIVARGSGNEYRRLEAIKRTGRAVIVPLDFPSPPNVASVESALDVPLEHLLHWDIAPENPGRLDRAGVTIALTSHGLDDRDQFLSAIRKAVERGLSEQAALRALTVTPAALFAVSDRLGTLEPGKAGNFFVTDGDLFAEDTKVLETWVNGRRYEVATSPLVDLRGDWRFTLTDVQGDSQRLVVSLSGKPNRLTGTVGKPRAKKKKRTKLDRLGLRDTRFSCLFDAGPFAGEGTARLTATVTGEASLTWTGHVVWPDGRRSSFSGTKIDTSEGARRKKKSEPAVAEADDAAKPAEKSDPTASFAVNYPLGAFGRLAAPQQPGTVLFKNATVWTVAEAGVLTNASVLVSGGKILAVGTEVDAPASAVVVDVKGKHITPGIIDCHSHMGTDGGVNESTQAITAEVRIADFIDADDINIYRQLAGGVTCINILHGSSNPIGGQNQVIKLRWGALPEELKFLEAPPGIKFALGENVKQSNWGDEYTSRYPQTRMGVEQIIHDALHAARGYEQRWQQWTITHEGVPPRRDLELEALAETLDGRRWIHCHAYRQDEILAFLRVCDDFGIQRVCLQHILEGYKVADEMARRGATASAFSDWWGYKFEVYDAIPYAGALMHQAGVLVSFNSDDRELARHLNHEAAKAVKYGGVPPEEALKFVTINSASQLQIDAFVGSLEPGKHADLVVWSGPPLSVFSRCEQTWIDGRKYFDVEEDRQLRNEAESMRRVLVQKILASPDSAKSAKETPPAEDELWPRDDIFDHE